MVSAKALAYCVYDSGDIDVNSTSCQILVVDKDATVTACSVTEGGVLIIKEVITLTVTGDFNCSSGTIYVFGTLNIEKTHDSNLANSTIYVMQGGGEV